MAFYSFDILFLDYLRCRKAFVSCSVPLLTTTFLSLLILGSLNLNSKLSISTGGQANSWGFPKGL